MNVTELFLTADEIIQLTGRKRAKMQVDQLRKMGIPFHLNAFSKPVIARAAIVGAESKPVEKKTTWQPPVACLR